MTMSTATTEPDAETPTRTRTCERAKCDQPAVAFALGQHVCATHTPAGSAACTHSLAPSGRCSYCGAPTPTTANRQRGHRP